MKLKFNRNKGITLIALVVTIIILLILAGITLTLALNNNGIISRTKQAVDASEMAQIKERAEMAKLGLEMDEWTTFDTAPLKRYAVINAIHKEFEGSKTGVGKVITADKKYDILVDKDSNITVEKHKEIQNDSKGEILIDAEVQNDYPNATFVLKPVFEDEDENIPSYEEYAEYFLETAESEDVIKESIAKTCTYMYIQLGRLQEGQEISVTDLFGEENKSLKDSIGENYKEILISWMYVATVEYMEEYGEEVTLTFNNVTRKTNTKWPIGCMYQLTEPGEYKAEAETSDGRKGERTLKFELLTVTPETITVFEENSETITAEGINGKITWQSSDESVATVENGVITGVSAGTAKISASNEEHTAISTSCSVTVRSNKIDGSMVVKETTPENDTMTNEGLQTSNENIATITSEGIIKSSRETGEVNITLTENGKTKVYKMQSTAKIVYTANTTKSISGTPSYNNPVIPEGYSALDTEDAKWSLTQTTQPDVNKGLVIMDEDGNQFVWIPVKNPVSDTEANGTTNKAMAINLGTEEKPQYRGLFYKFTDENGKVSSTIIEGCTTETRDTLREPDILSNYDNDSKTYLSDIGLTASQFAENIQNDYDELIQNVIDYGGFYIGRCKSSLINDKTRSVPDSFVMFADSQSSHLWYGLYQRQKNYSTTSNGRTITTGNMMYGSQFMAILHWMMDNGVNVVSYRPMGLEIKFGYHGELLRGHRLKNIYHLLDSTIDWTQAAYEYKANHYGLQQRRAIMDLPQIGTDAGVHGPDSDWHNNSARICLYIK